MKFIANSEIRLNKFLADNGVCSRREADRMIESRKVKVNDKFPLLGLVLKANDVVTVLSEAKELKYFLYYKPVGETTGPNNKMPNTHPVGRLDKNSDGLLIYTNDHKLFEDLLNPANKIQKEYKVTTRERPTPRVKEILERGIKTQEGTYAPALEVRIAEESNTIHIVLTEGKKHEIRRMLNALNLTINTLTRIRINKLTINKYKLRPEQFREITLEEIFNKK